MMSKGHRIREVLTNEEYSGTLYEDMDEAILGIYRKSPNRIIPVYSYIKYIEILVRQGMSEEEAIEYVDTNVFPIDDMYNPIIIDDTGV
tara:strand:- start:233 stop:499 length:267 start_codon:yes stop_codon:yes gene_type:complete